MKKKMFIGILFTFITITCADNGELPPFNTISIAQICATPSLPIFIGGQDQVEIWIKLVEDIQKWDGKGYNSERPLNSVIMDGLIIPLKQIIHNGFEPKDNIINEQALVAVMWFIRSINKNKKAIQLYINTESYSIKKFQAWKVIKDHLFFANLINQGKISCINMNNSVVYHPTNFDNDKKLPFIIRQIARSHGPFFQDIALKTELPEKPPQRLMKYAHFQCDPRTLKKIYCTFPYESLKVNQKPSQ
jgi:hypothetical protein